ncbi:MDR family oxidoreductase [Defluviicoccus vanus]|uniref:Oxidoreductase n=1 Tax=Defluviicoccus vanus TaxID=111831 RepID=A0A7H1N4F3_9PROT|nr:MDR family oxidoreductase [Defluviicoccus vanus]QNT70589.1 oxidoreductase [Defluviicoccus vanus]
MSDSQPVRALILEQETGESGVRASVQEVSEKALPEGDVLVAVHYSDLNYKDGLVLGGLGRLVRTYPHVPGIDFAGVVEASASPLYKPGDSVILTGWRVGEVRWGGYASKARVKAEWLVPLPEGMTLHQAMAIGTAGFTAMLALMALEEHGLQPENKGEVLVTGAAGGVGSIAVALLANLGYRVAAVTGRPDTHDYLRALGATTIVDRSELETPPKGPLAAERWSGAIDNVGGASLGTLLAGLCYWASCASVGNASGIAFNATVIPFLLRGVNLLGIDSATCPRERRLVAWPRLARELPMDKLAAITHTVPLGEAPAMGRHILKGIVRGRTVIDVNS